MPVSAEEARLLSERLRRARVESVAICFLHSYLNDSNERELEVILQEWLPGIPITRSSALMPRPGEFERASTAAVNAALAPVVEQYLQRLRDSLDEIGITAPIYMMRSDGGLARISGQAVQTILSGPAGGVIASLKVGRDSESRHLMSVDMGGTSFDIALLPDRRIELSSESEVDGIPISTRSIRIHTLGAGGGSVAWVDDGGGLRVGPRSAGAWPGPACYGLGGLEPTVTDANLVLGRLGESLLDRGLKLDRDLASRAIELAVAVPMGLTIEDAALGIIRVVNAEMARGMRDNDRNLFFGIDNGSQVSWTDHGRPSPSTVMVCALVVYDGDLYAATWEVGESEVGHVYRLDGDRWVDCGTPSNANAVTRLAVHDGRLYAGGSRLRGGGSGMPETVNQEPGGRIARYEGGDDWSDCGQLDDADSVAGLVPFAGDLYAIPMYSEGLFRYDGAAGWVPCGSPGRRLLALGVHDGALYGAGNDHADVASAIAQTAAGIVVPPRSGAGGGGMFRFDGGTSWTSLGLQADTTQVYSIETYGGDMFIGTWPKGIVYRHAGGQRWDSAGYVGTETEVMNLLAYNGMLYAGTLPGAEVHRFDRDGRWTNVGILDGTLDVRYRRAASMAIHRGELFCGTLPSGTVHSMQAGVVVSNDRALPIGWCHIAAVRSTRTIVLYVDGSLVARRTEPEGDSPVNVGTASTLILGGGPRSGFEGELADVRLYRRALRVAEIQRSAGQLVGRS